MSRHGHCIQTDQVLRSELLTGLSFWFLEVLYYCRNLQAQCTMKQFSVPCSFIFLVISFCWTRQGNTHIFVCNYSWGYYVPMYINNTQEVVDSSLQPSFIECINISWFCGTERRVCSSLCTATISILCSEGPTHIHEHFPLLLLSCEHLQYRPAAYPQRCFKATCFLPGFCEQSISSSANFLKKGQENSHWSEERGKVCYLLLVWPWKEALRFCRCTNL